MRRIAWLRLSALVVAFVVLAGTGLFGIYSSVDEWNGAQTLFQKSVTAGQAIYGILGTIAVVGLFLRKFWSVRFAIAWGAVATYVGSAAVTAYGDAPNPVSATLGALAACVAVTAIVVWCTVIGSRRILSYDDLPN